MGGAAPLSILTRSDQMREVLARVDTVAASDSAVLLIGETGVGKELFAEYLHRVGARSERPLVKIALSAMPHELLESELFGHERGAFTHAVQEKVGLFEVADGGTLFLDDIDDVPLPIQTKLLRVLECHEVLRVGGSRPIPVDVRLISASKVDLVELSDVGRFRKDLLYRINVVPVEIPPLRHRAGDVPLLLEHFLRRFAHGRPIRITEEALRHLKTYDWPGNVRELRNVAQRLALFAEDEVRPEHLPRELRQTDPLAGMLRACSRCLIEGSMALPQVVACLESHLILEAMDRAEGNQSQAARLLGLSLSTFRDKVQKHGLNGPVPPEQTH